MIFEDYSYLLKIIRNPYKILDSNTKIKIYSTDFDLPENCNFISTRKLYNIYKESFQDYVLDYDFSSSCDTLFIYDLGYLLRDNIEGYPLLITNLEILNGKYIKEVTISINGHKVNIYNNKDRKNRFMIPIFKNDVLPIHCMIGNVKICCEKFDEYKNTNWDIDTIKTTLKLKYCPAELFYYISLKSRNIIHPLDDDNNNVIFYWCGMCCGIYNKNEIEVNLEQKISIPDRIFDVEEYIISPEIKRKIYKKMMKIYIE